MIAKKSPMEFIGFSILNTEVNVTLPKNGEELADASTYEIEIDFEVKQAEVETQYVIVCKTIINEQGLSGYSMRIVCANQFNFDAGMGEVERQQMLYFSAVGMCIANIRTYLANITSYSILLPKYTLPAIDMNKLIQAKIDSQNEVSE